MQGAQGYLPTFSDSNKLDPIGVSFKNNLFRDCIYVHSQTGAKANISFYMFRFLFLVCQLRMLMHANRLDQKKIVLENIVQI